MSQFRLYVDEDSQSEVLMRLLREAGLDVLTSKEAGMDGASDGEQLGFAIRERRVLLTANIRDYRRLQVAAASATGASHAGMIFLVRRFSIGEIVRRIVRLHSALSAEEMADREEFLSQ